MKTRRQAVQWIDGPYKTGCKGGGDEDLNVKPGEDESFGKKGAPQLDVLKLELEQPQDPVKGTQEASPSSEGEIREASPDPKEGTQETLPDPEEIREAPLDPGQEAREVPSDCKEETREASSDPDEETRETPSDLNEKTWEVPSNPEKETQEAPSDSEKTKDVAGLAAGSTDLERLSYPRVGSSP